MKALHQTIALLSIILSISSPSPVSSASLPIPHKRATICNGQAALCDRPYGNVTFLGAHDSFTADSDPLDLASDQRVSLADQLALGVRLLQAQAHDNNGVLHFCHTSCLLFDGGTVQNYLTTVKTFLDANPNEVLTLIFTNPDGLSLTGQWGPAFDASGMTPLMYIPPHLPMTRSDWPTLGDLIDSGKRVIFFMDAGADPSVVDYILPEFEMVWETPFSVTNASFPCSVDRIAGPLSTADHMYMINHSLNINIIPIGGGVIVSDPEAAGTTNGVTSILANANGCAPLASNHYPNFVLLDFVNIGQGLEAVNLMNGFSADSNTTSTSNNTTANGAVDTTSSGTIFLALAVGGLIML